MKPATKTCPVDDSFYIITLTLTPEKVVPRRTKKY